MKNLQILMMCCFLVLLTACGREGGTAQTPVASEEITESITQMPDEQESEAMPENMELGLTVNGVYYPIPISLKQLTDDGWKISGQTPYFLEPFVGEEYSETRADWSLSKDGQEILPGGSIIRLLEKDGVLLEVTITNQVSTGSDTPSQKIEDGVVDSIIKTNYLVIPGQKRSRCRSNRGIIDSPTPLFTPFCRFRYRSRGQIHSHQYPRTSSTNDPFLKWFSYTSRMMRIAMSTSPF